MGQTAQDKVDEAIRELDRIAAGESQTMEDLETALAAHRYRRKLLLSKLPDIEAIGDPVASEQDRLT